jgi:hypothetical protein
MDLLKISDAPDMRFKGEYVRKARLFQAKEWDPNPTKMWVFHCPCEPRDWQYWGFAAAYGTMLWHFHLYHRRTNG